MGVPTIPAGMHTPKSYFAVVLLALNLVSGCAGLQRRPAPSVEQVVEMSREGKPAAEIIQELQETRAVYPLTASQIIALHDQGVADPVLDYMQNAYATSIRWDARMQYEGVYWWHDCFYCYRRPVIVMPR